MQISSQTRTGRSWPGGHFKSEWLRIYEVKGVRYFFLFVSLKIVSFSVIPEKQ